jgi:hypothetical protein
LERESGERKGGEEDMTFFFTFFLKKAFHVISLNEGGDLIKDMGSFQKLPM